MTRRQHRAAFLADDSGQDLIEYGLLVGVVTVGLIAILPTLQANIATVFNGWGTQVNALWTPPAP
jgi:Flp pilus assembly pilin Flp